jgi:hypothetical protein
VSEAVATRMSGANPDVEKAAQPRFADCGLKMFRPVIDGVPAVMGSDPSRVITMTAERIGAPRCLGSIRSIQM